MSALGDPPRLIDDASGGWLQQALDASRADVPNEAQLDELWERIVSTPPGGPEDGGPEDGGPDGGAPADEGPPQPPAVDPTRAATAAGSSLLSGAAAKLALVLTLGGALAVSAASGHDDANLHLSSGWSAPPRLAAATAPRPLEGAPPQPAPSHWWTARHGTIHAETSARSARSSACRRWPGWAAAPTRWRWRARWCSATRARPTRAAWRRYFRSSEPVHFFS